jgi:hypothetical protein
MGRHEVVLNVADEGRANGSPAAASGLFASLNDDLKRYRATAGDGSTVAKASSRAATSKSPLDELAELIDAAWLNYASDLTPAPAIVPVTTPVTRTVMGDRRPMAGINLAGAGDTFTVTAREIG